MATENTPQLSPLSSEDEEMAQKSLDHLDKNGTPKVTTKWTGFQGKTLWDWLQLFGILAIPLVVAGATLLFSIQQANLAQQQHENDQKIALDQQRQAVLVKYQDDMRDLLLNKGLLTSKPGDEIRAIALTETLSAMSQLDAKRISFLIRFLQYAHLNGVVPASAANYNIVNFSGADLSAIDFTGADLSGAYLKGAYLKGATLSGATLGGANLSDAFLGDTNLSAADLSAANLSDAFLGDANLSAATLYRANLSDTTLGGANLRSADLSGADLTVARLATAQNLTQQQLDQVYSCTDATLPQGLTCHRNSSP
jgi:uncharacterized protein YjbI with pentapeptide repeats